MWRDLCNHNLSIAYQPWLILGDFNVTLNPSESVGGQLSITTGMQDFRDCVETLEMEDISSTGVKYTCNGKPHDTNRVLKKLD